MTTPLSLPVADRMMLLGSESAFEVLARARALEAQGKHVVHLEIGEPDFDTPKHVVEAAKKALDDGYTHYTPSVGLMETRAAVSRHLQRTRGLEVDPARVAITVGAKPVLFYALLALVNPGDEVIYPDPGYPIYESMARFVGAKPVPLPLREDRQFRFDPAELRALVTPRTRLIILNSPQNPTGGVFTRSDLEAVAAIAQEHDLVVLADEIYERILYSGEHVSIATLPGMLDRTVLADGWSKTYAMTGWRLGFGVFPLALMPHVERLAVNSVSCPAAFTQIAAIAALEGPQEPVMAMVDAFRERREALVNGLNELPGVRCHLPEGAFYAFPNIQGTGLASRQLADLLLQEGGVACLAGSAFGPQGEGFLRFSYANSLDNIHLALDRMRDVLERRAG